MKEIPRKKFFCGVCQVDLTLLSCDLNAIDLGILIWAVGRGKATDDDVALSIWPDVGERLDESLIGATGSSEDLEDGQLALTISQRRQTLRAVCTRLIGRNTTRSHLQVRSSSPSVAIN